jgi:hypothetical protein
LFAQYVINLPLAPVIVLFADNDGWLPNWLYWFQTPDNSLDGDSGWKTENRPYLNESNKYRRWINRFHWLWRNAVYGFSEQVLGVKYQMPRDTVYVEGNPNVSNGPPGKSGLVKRYLYRNHEMIAFQWYYIRQYNRWPDKCIRINIGWKLWSFSDPGAVAAHFVFSLSPFMHFKP